MLNLTRKVGESVMIGDDIEVTVSSITRNATAITITGVPHTKRTTLMPGKLFHLREGVGVVLRKSRRGEVRLGFVAPKTLPVHRREVYDRGPRIHTTVGLYPNGDYKVNGVEAEHFLGHLAYNRKFRPGRALFVDGICVLKGIGITDDELDAFVEKAESLKVSVASEEYH